VTATALSFTWGSTMDTLTRILATSALLVTGGLLAPVPGASAATPACTNADLTASYHGGDGAAGTTYGRIVLTNTSGHTCRTGGYGGISYVGDGNGTQIGAPAVRIDAEAAKTIVLAPGQRVRSSLDEVNALNFPKARCHPTHVDGFRVYVPNSTVSQYVVHPHVGCRNPHVKLMFQKPLLRP
jgi:hypothetical protein